MKVQKVCVGFVVVSLVILIAGCGGSGGDEQRLAEKATAAAGAEQPGGSSTRSTGVAFGDIVPIDTGLEVAGTFEFFADSTGRVAKIEGIAEVVKGGSFVKRGRIGGGPAGVSKGVEMEFLAGGRVKLTIPEGAKVDYTYSIWLPGLVHRIQGRITGLGQEGYTFDSNSSDPLHFKIVNDVGYMHVGGKGTVSTPSGKVERFE